MDTPGEGIASAAIYRRVRCPRCGSTNTRVHTSRAPVRYHRCRDCNHRFKSVEE